jgi:hypothetical protein
MKKTYEMKINNSENIVFKNPEIFHKIIEDPFIPSEVESYLSVNIFYLININKINNIL